MPFKHFLKRAYFPVTGKYARLFIWDDLSFSLKKKKQKDLFNQHEAARCFSVLHLYTVLV